MTQGFIARVYGSLIIFQYHKKGFFDHFNKALKRLQKSNDEESFETKALDLVRMGGKRLGMIRRNLTVYENQKIRIQFTPFH